jgi:hypothetical protein
MIEDKNVQIFQKSLKISIKYPKIVLKRQKKAVDPEIYLTKFSWKNVKNFSLRKS